VETAAVSGAHSSEAELARISDLLRLTPKNRISVLDVGARDGRISRHLTQFFQKVVALDLEKPCFRYPGIETVAGDATKLQFPDASFDCIVCSEVLEHIPDLERACRELARVAKYEVLIGVPFQQDINVGRMTCRTCGKATPPFGHVNSFTESKLRKLFSGMIVRDKSFVGEARGGTNPISVRLMDLAGNPWGPYNQQEPCVHCGARLIPPPVHRPLWSKVCSGVAARLNAVQTRFAAPHGNWIHILFAKTDGVSAGTR
jgi:SAM-dependent methyltransferase